MKASTRIHWGMGGVGATVLFAGLTRAAGSRGWNLVLCAVGSLLLLLAMGMPQLLARSALTSFDGHIRTARSEQDADAAIRLCQNAAAGLSALPTRETGEMSWLSAFSSLVNGRGQTEAIAIYRRRHRAAAIHAVEVALEAGAADDGALQLAQRPGSDADLLGLKAELLRMVVELDPRPR